MGVQKLSLRRVLPVRNLFASLLAIFMVASVLTTFAFVSPVEAAVGNPNLTLGNVPGASGNAIETGTAIFDGQGDCSGGAPLAPPVPFPGNDCSAGDNVVRTNDLVNYGYSVGVSNLLGASDPGGPEHIDDTYFSQTITPNSPDAVVAFDGLPPACRTGTNPDTGNPYDPQSQIVPLAGGSSQLICNVGRVTGPSQTIFLQTKVRVDGTSKNNASFTSTDALCEGAPEDPPGTPAGGCTVVTDRTDVDGVNAQDITPDTETYISAAPQYDLAKNKYGPNATGIITHPVTGELGYRYRFYPTIEVDPTADGKGSSPLDGDITFEDMMYVTGTTTPIPGFEMNPTGTDCYWNNHGGRPIPYGVITHGSNPDRNVADTGTVGCTQAAPGAPIEITLTGTDTTGNHFPTYGSNGVTTLQPPYYVAALYQYIWVPFEVIDRYDPAAACDAADTTAGYSAPFCGDIDDSGTLPLTNCLSEFDPDALDANGDPVSNYGAGVEPGIYGAGDGNNNCKSSSMTLSNRGGASKYYNTKVVNGGWVGGVPPGQTGYHTGDGPLEPNQYIAVASRFYNSGTFPFTNGMLCEKVDTMTQTLVPIQTTAAWVPTDAAGRNLPVEVHMTGGTYDPNLLVVEYASGPAGTPANGFVQWDNDHLVGGLNPLTGLYDSSTAVSQKATDCSDANGNWTTDPYSFDANDQASLQKIRSVRVTYLGTMEPNMDIRMGIELQMLNNFNGGPYNGQIIPAGVILPNFIAYRTDQLSSGDWRNSTYNQNSDSGSTGDRMITSRGYVRISKHLVPYTTDHSVANPPLSPVDSGLSGDPFQFRLYPSVRSNITSGAPLTGVTVTDVLPSWLIFDPGCTATVSAYPPPIIQTNTPNPGETTLVWNLGTVVPNGTLDPIDFCVTSDQLAPDGTNAVNTVVISANEDVSTERQREASATVVLNQIGEFRVQKAVDSALDPQANNQVYTMEWFNSSDFVTLDAPIVIDVFPHNLDETGEGSAAPNSPGSDFAGTTWLAGPATSTATGDFFYSKRDEFFVSNNAIAASNPFSSAPYDLTNPNLGPLPDTNDDGESDAGTTIWCLATDFGTVGCPANYAEATSLMFVGDAEIDPGTGDSVSFTMDTNGNDPGDLYANNYAGFTPSLPGQVSVSNTVTVRVGGMALGDLVWFDWNDNGIYEPALGETPVPDGVTVELLDGSLAPLGPVTTTVNGRYVFDELDPGTYAVRIPASEFAVGAPLEGLVPSTPVGVPDDDEDEGVDQHGTVAGGAVVTAPIVLSWTTIGPDADGNVDIAGDEPLGDDNGSILIGYDDALHNLTLDIGLVGDPALTIVKDINGDDANAQPGPYLAAGDAITWSYEVENTGNTVLEDVTIVDDQGVTVVCPALGADPGGDNVIDVLQVGESLICTGTGVATGDGSYTNIGTATATPPSGEEFEETDPANYFGMDAEILLEKATNTIDADNPNGPLIDENGAVTWTYEVENSGNVALTDVAVTDNLVAAADISCDTHLGDADGNNVIALMLPGDVVECEATGTATADQYANTGSVVGNPVTPTSPGAGFDPEDPETYPTDPSAYTDAGIDDVDHTDDSHYYGTDPSVVLEKATNTVDADTPTGPIVDVGSTVTWTYEVTNDGNVPLLDVTVTDNVVAAADISCDTHRGDANSDNVIALMLPGDVVECEATGTAIAGQYANTGSVAGDPVFPTASGDYDPDDPDSWPTDPADYTDTGDGPQEDTDPSHYFGSNPAVVIEKATNTVDADSPNGPLIAEGGAVTWTYEVENSGNTALMNVAVTDNLVAAADISCESHRGDVDGNNIIAMLLPGDIVECEATGLAIEGQYANTASVTGDPTYPDPSAPGFDPDDPETWPTDPTDYTDTGDEDPSDTDDSHYWGTDPSVVLEKATNTVDADTPTGPVVAVGSTVTWTYEVTNDGTIPLLDVTVTDNLVAAADISCDPHRGDVDGDNVIALMVPGDVVECEATGLAVEGQYANTGSVVADPVFPTASGDYDPTDPDSWPTDPANYTDTGDTDPSDTDPSHYFGSNPEIVIEKATNGVDADSAPGPSVEVGDTITWTYEIENTGNTALINVGVTDNLVAAADISCDTHRGDADGNNVITLLLPDDVVECEATGVATGGQYENTGSTSGDPVYPSDPSAPGFDPDDPETWPTDPSGYGPTGDPAVDDTDDSHYIGAAPSVGVEKSTNGVDADTVAGPYVPVGGDVTWTYEVTNDGNTALVNVAVNDNQLAAADISCETHRGDADGDNVIALMLPGDVVECEATGTATADQYTNTADVAGDPAMPDPDTCGCDLADPETWASDDPSDYVDVPDTENPTATDPSHYYGSTPELTLEKSTNGVDADTPTGPNIPEGGVVTWVYEIENTGNTPMTAVAVTDSVVAAADISCANHMLDTNGDNIIDVLLPDDVVLCTATGVAIAGQYTNTGTAEGQPSFPTNPGPDFDPSDPTTYPTDPTGYGPVIDPDTGLPVPTEDGDDPSHYFGSDAAAVVEKATNGEDADAVTGPWILEGDTVTWTYVITNPSNSALTGVTLTDDQVPATDIVCETYLLDADGDNVIALLLPGAEVTCTATAPATTLGQYENTATIVGQPVYPTNPGPDFDPDDSETWPTDPADYSDVVDPTTGESVPPSEDTDPSHYWGATSSIDLEKLINDVDEDEAPGAQLDNGDTATWSFVVTNTGTVPQTNVVVSDDDAAVTVDCGDGTNIIGVLLPGAVVTCVGTAVVEAGSYVNVGSVSGQPSFPDSSDPAFDPSNPDTWPTDPTGYSPIVDPATGEPTDPDTADDPSHHFGNGAAVELIKDVCVFDDGSTCDPANDDHWADEALHHSGSVETWRITVENTGNVELSDVIVSDPAIPLCDNAIGTMAPGDIVVFTCDGDPGAAPSTNTASVTAVGPSGTEVSSSDTATLRPPPELKIEKTVADDSLTTGDTATFTLKVTNVGAGSATMTEVVDKLPVGLRFVAVTTAGAVTSYDASSTSLTWQIGDLAPGESATITYTATVSGIGTKTNTAVVSSAEVEATSTLDDNTDTASVSVKAAPAPPSSVAFTGSSSWAFAGTASVLLLAGIGLVLFARRRRPTA